METVAAFPFFPVEITKAGKIFDPDQVTALIQAAVAAPAATDLLVLVHGWNNDMANARALYTEMLDNLGAMPGGRRLMVMAVFWPSKRFADSDLIPGGGAASVADPAAAAALKARLAELVDGFDNGGPAEIAALAALVDRLGEADARRDFANGVRALLPADLGEEDGAATFLAADPAQLFDALDLGVRLLDPQAGEGGGAAMMDDTGGEGGEAGIASLGSGILSAAQRLLNLSTFYQMKARAGLVGATLNFILAQIREKIPGLRIHLAGHSFGARVATAAVAGPTPFEPASLVLLQGAFSHNGLSADFDGTKDGVFHTVLDEDRVKGPIAVTHTANDRAVGLAYAIASRLAGDNAAAVGDATDPFGGLGRNGALHVVPAKVVAAVLPAAGTALALAPGKVTNLLADAWIHDHSDVRNPAAVWALRSAMLAGAGP